MSSSSRPPAKRVRVTKESTPTPLSPQEKRVRLSTLKDKLERCQEDLEQVAKLGKTLLANYLALIEETSVEYDTKQKSQTLKLKGERCFDELVSGFATQKNFSMFYHDRKLRNELHVCHCCWEFNADEDTTTLSSSSSSTTTTTTSRKLLECKCLIKTLGSRCTQGLRLCRSCSKNLQEQFPSSMVVCSICHTLDCRNDPKTGLLYPKKECRSVMVEVVPTPMTSSCSAHDAPQEPTSTTSTSALSSSPSLSPRSRVCIECCTKYSLLRPRNCDASRCLVRLVTKGSMAKIQRRVQSELDDEVGTSNLDRIPKHIFGCIFDYLNAGEMSRFAITNYRNYRRVETSANHMYQLGILRFGDSWWSSVCRHRYLYGFRGLPDTSCQDLSVLEYHVHREFGYQFLNDPSGGQRFVRRSNSLLFKANEPRYHELTPQSEPSHGRQSFYRDSFTMNQMGAICAMEELPEHSKTHFILGVVSTEGTDILPGIHVGLAKGSCTALALCQSPIENWAYKIKLRPFDSSVLASPSLMKQAIFGIKYDQISHTMSLLCLSGILDCRWRHSSPLAIQTEIQEVNTVLPDTLRWAISLGEEGFQRRSSFPTAMNIRDCTAAEWEHFQATLEERSRPQRV